MAEGAPILRTRASRLSRERVYSLEDAALVRRSGGAVARWPLAGLRRITFGVRRSPYAPPVRFARLRFAGHVETIVAGPAAGAFAPFARALAAVAADSAPGVRLEAEGGRLAAALILAAALLAAGATALTLSALMAGLAPLGLDMAARLSFLLILIFALTPWIGRMAPRRLDPRDLPAGLLE